MVNAIQLPNKSLFKMDEVSCLVGVKPYVLRFWESQFSEISPIRSSSGQMLYREEDIKVIAKIKSLLFEKKLSVEQARLSMNKVIEEEVCEVCEVSEVKEVKEIEKVQSPLNSSSPEFLLSAREKLSKILALTQALKQTHHWD